MLGGGAGFVAHEPAPESRRFTVSATLSRSVPACRSYTGCAASMMLFKGGNASFKVINLGL
jgi:hypothetical protein